jgi:hypothetical protein
MLTTVAFVGVIIMLVGLALSAYAIDIIDGRNESRFRGL